MIIISKVLSMVIIMEVMDLFIMEITERLMIIISKVLSMVIICMVMDMVNRMDTSMFIICMVNLMDVGISLSIIISNGSLTTYNDTLIIVNDIIITISTNPPVPRLPNIILTTAPIKTRTPATPRKTTKHPLAATAALKHPLIRLLHPVAMPATISRLQPTHKRMTLCQFNLLQCESQPSVLVWLA
jgi:hypothetical protein